MLLISNPSLTSIFNLLSVGFSLRLDLQGIMADPQAVSKAILDVVQPGWIFMGGVAASMDAFRTRKFRGI